MRQTFIPPEVSQITDYAKAGNRVVSAANPLTSHISCEVEIHSNSKDTPNH